MRTFRQTETCFRARSPTGLPTLKNSTGLLKYETS
jgi:hypothetical protein